MVEAAAYAGATQAYLRTGSARQRPPVSSQPLRQYPDRVDRPASDNGVRAKGVVPVVTPVLRRAPAVLRPLSRLPVPDTDAAVSHRTDECHVADAQGGRHPADRGRFVLRPGVPFCRNAPRLRTGTVTHVAQVCCADRVVSGRNHGYDAWRSDHHRLLDMSVRVDELAETPIIMATARPELTNSRGLASVSFCRNRGL